jgi:hypothetical protein
LVPDFSVALFLFTYSASLFFYLAFGRTVEASIPVSQLSSHKLTAKNGVVSIEPDNHNLEKFTDRWHLSWPT